MPTEPTRWGALGLGRRGITPPKRDLAALEEVFGPSLLDRMVEQDRLSRSRLGRGEYGPPPVDSPEFELAADVAGNLDFTGALKGVSLADDLASMAVPTEVDAINQMAGMATPQMTGMGLDLPKTLLPGSPAGVFETPRQVPLVEPGSRWTPPDLGGRMDPTDEALWDQLKGMEGKLWEPGELFDYRRLGDLPPMPQTRLPRAEPPKQGFPDYLTRIGDPANMKRVKAVVEAGIEMGGREWYNTEPLRMAFVDELGEVEGNAAHRFFMDVMGATSPRSKVHQNIKSASYHFQRARAGHTPVTIDPVNKGVFINPKTGEKKLSNLMLPPLPGGYGHRMQAVHATNLEDMYKRGFLDPKINPKISAFSANLWGNQFPLAADVHNVRMLGLTTAGGKPVNSPEGSHYAWLEDLQRAHAEELGLTPAQYQASMWIGGANETKMLSPQEPFLRTFERHIDYTARQREQKKTQVLRDFIKGKAPLLSVGPMTGMLFRALLPEDVEVDDDLDKDDGA